MGVLKRFPMCKKAKRKLQKVFSLVEAVKLYLKYCAVYEKVWGLNYFNSFTVNSFVNLHCISKYA